MKFNKKNIIADQKAEAEANEILDIEEEINFIIEAGISNWEFINNKD